MKRFASILLALAMVFAMTTTAFAATNDSNGSITVNNAVSGETYSVYQILKLESYNADAKSYLYKAADGWAEFVSAQSDYFNVDASGYVTWKGDATAARAAVVAQAALAYAAEKDIQATKSAKAEGTTVKIEGLNLGYYLVDSSLGALCALDTTDPNGVVNEKNGSNTVDKKVQENSKVNDQDKGWGTRSDANIGDTVPFKAEVNLKKGTTNVVFHDKMTEGLTFNAKSVVVKVGETALTAGTDYTFVASPSDDCTFEVKFTETYLAALTADTTVTITYSAVLNDKAVAGKAENNKDYLTYGDSQKTTENTTETYTWEFDVFKYAKGEGDTEIPLSGAVFSLYTDDACTAENIVKFNKVENQQVYRYNANGSVTQITTDNTGKFNLEGLDSGTYYLKEITAPDGYNVLTEAVKVVIDANGNVSSAIGSAEQVASTDKEVGVLNQSGTELPETGGMGTTLFYVLGGILVAGAAILLVVKRRMSGAER